MHREDRARAEERGLLDEVDEVRESRFAPHGMVYLLDEDLIAKMDELNFLDER